jgi:site-specific recombinase XerC
MVTALLHTGLRVSEVVGLRLSDVEMSKRKGSLTVRGKGTEQREVPLNMDARKALQQWLKVQPNVNRRPLLSATVMSPWKRGGRKSCCPDIERRGRRGDLYREIVRQIARETCLYRNSDK